MKVQAVPGIDKQVPAMHYWTPPDTTTLPLMAGNRLKALHGFVIPLNLPILSSIYSDVSVQMPCHHVARKSRHGLSIDTWGEGRATLVTSEMCVTFEVGQCQPIEVKRGTCQSLGYGKEFKKLERIEP